jgi:hypothetical protein
MSCSEGPVGSGRFDPCGCDPEKVFEYADKGDSPEGLDSEQEKDMREHLASCSECRELYERELDLNAFLSCLVFSEMRSTGNSVYQGVAMALPIRSARVRILWGLLASTLLAVAFVSLKFNGTEPVTLAMSTLGACWGLIVGLAKVSHSVFAVAGPTLLLMLALGALADLLIALVVLSVSRNRQAREA